MKLFLTSVLLFTSVVYAQIKTNYQSSTAGFFATDVAGARQVFSFNNGWLYYKGNLKNAETPGFKTTGWQSVQLPHGIDILPEEASGGINYKGIVWYRKKFSIPAGIATKKISLHFEAIMGKCKIWLNGQLIREHKGGYLPVIIDLPQPLLTTKQENLIAVIADNSDDNTYPPGKEEKNLDFCYFGGIYRDAWLIATNDIFVTNSNQVNKPAGGGVFVHYENVSKEKATVKIATDIANSSNVPTSVMLESTIKYGDNIIIATASKEIAIAAKAAATAEQSFDIVNPKLWNPETPFLYKLYTVVKDRHNNIIDGFYQNIGIRSIEFRAKEGLYLNGELYKDKLVGVNRHQDYAYIGNAVPNNLHWRDAKLLREAGVKVIRASHYPQDPAFMDACDAMGIFIIVPNPGWQYWNNAPSFATLMYDDIRQMIRRDRNHPSVIMWEPVPNETYYPVEYAKNAYHVTHVEYPFRDCYAACIGNAPGSEIYDVWYEHPSKELFSKTQKPVFTREWGDYVDDWNSHNSPSRVRLGWGEEPQLIQAKHYANPTYTNTSWEALYESPAQLIGGCLWHAFDTHRGYHPDNFYGGIMDGFRQPKYSYYLFKSQQNNAAGNLFQSGNPFSLFFANEMSPFSPKDITIFTNCDSVRLIAFGKDTFTQKPNPLLKMPHPPIVFENVFEFSKVRDIDRVEKHFNTTIKVQGFANGKIVLEQTKSIAKRPSKLSIKLGLDGQQPVADGSFVIPVYVEIQDEQGLVRRLNDQLVKLSVEGEAKIIGDESIQANPKRIEWGTAPFLLHTTLTPGKIKLVASVYMEGSNTPLPDTLELQSIQSTFISIYNKKDVSFSSSDKINVKNQPAKKHTETEAERRMRLNKVGKDQESFGEKRKNVQ